MPEMERCPTLMRHPMFQFWVVDRPWNSQVLGTTDLFLSQSGFLQIKAWNDKKPSKEERGGLL